MGTTESRARPPVLMPAVIGCALLLMFVLGFVDSCQILRDQQWHAPHNSPPSASPSRAMQGGDR